LAEFQIADKITRRNEGGWQNDPADTGNDKQGNGTYKGLASTKQPRWKGWPIIAAAIAELPPQPRYWSKSYHAWVERLEAALGANEELQTLVDEYYKANFWDVNRLTDLRSQEAANHVYDHGVNRGVGTAAILLQRVLGVKLDGNIGPVTLATANKLPDLKLAEMYREARKADYRHLVEKNPKLARYEGTWLKRC